MIDIKKEEECCGCYGCTNVCPKECISMEIDNEGFWYPKIDKSRCIDCSLCEKVCPVISEVNKEKFKPIAYACKSKNNEIRANSSSGGVFSLLCEEVINKGGVVFGASFDENFEVRHVYAETLEECIQFRGSKYVQSKIGEAYKKAKEFLNNGRVVLFSGTQCQIKGLNLYLRKKYDNLIAVDIVCHGVPSPKVFRSYREMLVKLNGDDIKAIRFRDKVKGWHEFSYVTEFKNGKVHSQTLREDMYMKGFLKDLYLRPSCYDCRAKNYSNGSDLTLADYWGVQVKHTEFDDDKGVSLILSNSKKGKSVFKDISNVMDILETDLEFAINNNPCIVRPVHRNPKRSKFFKEFDGENLGELVIKYTKPNFITRVKGGIWRVLSNVKRLCIKIIK